jgi:hypothetical protein
VQVIFDHHIENYGGQKRLDTLNNIVLAGFCSTTSSVDSVQVTKYRSKPYFYRYERIKKGDTLCGCFDGLKHKFSSHPQKNTIKILSQIRSSNSDNIRHEGFINDYISVADKVRLINIINEDTLTLYELSYITADLEQTFYIDTKQFLLRKQIIINKNNGLNEVTEFSNFRSIESIILPMTVRNMTRMNDGSSFGLKTVTHYTSAKFNQTLDPALFRCE